MQTNRTYPARFRCEYRQVQALVSCFDKWLATRRKAAHLRQHQTNAADLSRHLRSCGSGPVGVALAATITTEAQYRRQMSAAAMSAANSIVETLTEFHVSDSDEGDVMRKLSFFAFAPRLELGNYLDEILNRLRTQTLRMNYLVAESEPVTYLDQLFEEMEGERKPRLFRLIANQSMAFRDYRPGPGVSITGSIPSALINELRNAQQAGIRKLREWASGLSGTERQTADMMISIVEGISDVFITFLLFITAIQFGAISELFGMVEGLVRLALGIMETVLLFFYGFIDGGRRFDERMNQTIEMLTQLPSAIKLSRRPMD